MLLSDFLEHETDAIITRWEAFAATCLPAAAAMKPLALRDHAREILQAIAKDLRTYQSRDAQEAKSKGEAWKWSPAEATAAETHAILRAQSGFDINQLAAEYRALRASVLRLWMDRQPPSGAQLEEVVRFNEAIDQALAESIAVFNDQVDEAEKLLLGMLGHDMRSPLQTIQMTARYLKGLNAGAEVAAAATRLLNGGARMKELLDDLVDFNRTRLGLGIRVVPEPVDLESLFTTELDQIRAAHPDQRVELVATGNCQGSWDGGRLQQVLGNLVLNAIKYGAKGAPVRVLLEGGGSAVIVNVRNTGPAIEASLIGDLFNPLKRGVARPGENDPGLGLGLYIVREIVKAHGGEVSVHSSDLETVFSVSLPRR